ncbi:MAG TPA: Holliday junction resolvase RuvX, partial [Thermoanaerobaculia bacterium]|nr:Holliday junction resolvase RuvX [Thermoanaerobaculia bacterium]
ARDDQRLDQHFARRLGEASGLPVDLHGEALTSVAADAALDDAGVPARGRAGLRDAEAAAVLLRDWFAAHPGGSA